MEISPLVRAQDVGSRECRIPTRPNRALKARLPNGMDQCFQGMAFARLKQIRPLGKYPTNVQKYYDVEWLRSFLGLPWVAVGPIGPKSERDPSSTARLGRGRRQ